MSNRIVLLAFIAAMGIGARADESGRLRAVPFVFVGDAGDCGPAPGSNIVTSAWLRGMGLPDNGPMNTTALERDPHSRLLLRRGANPRRRGPEGRPVAGRCVRAGIRLPQRHALRRRVSALQRPGAR